ncbi:MAG: glycosyltransferase [Planctomycetota bacterium]
MLSFVIPAHDEEGELPATLAALRAAVDAVALEHEIVVVDDACTDGTARVAREAGARVVTIDRRQISAARNAGAAAARGERLCFVDADTRIDAALLRAVIEALDAGAVGGGSRVRFDEPTPRWARIVVPVLLRGYQFLRLAAGCLVFARRADFEAVGGFDETVYAGEEALFSRKLGRRGRFVILSEPVLTSGRKLRTHTALELLGTMLRLSLLGTYGVRRRKGLDIWYAPRRADPARANPDAEEGRP